MQVIIALANSSLAEVVKDVWQSVVVDGRFVVNKEYGATISFQGKQTPISMWKKSGAGPINFKALFPSPHGPVFMLFAVSKNDVQRKGQVDLWARPEDVRQELIDKFNNLPRN
jgi:hypothetical protein